MSAPSGKADAHRDRVESGAAVPGTETPINEFPATGNSLLRLQQGAGNQAVQNLFGGGRPLPESLRGEMERRFDADFGAVRVHDHDDAHAAAGALGAKAFTYGNDVVFSKDRYAPDTAEGRKLLVHELAHVIQQSSRADLMTGGYRAAEAEADGIAEAYAGGGPLGITTTTGVGIARVPEDDAEIDLHKPLEIGETRAYRDSGGTTGRANRPSADVFVIETDLRRGQSTTRADYQTKALPSPDDVTTPEGRLEPLIPLGKGLFRKAPRHRALTRA